MTTTSFWKGIVWGSNKNIIKWGGVVNMTPKSYVGVRYTLVIVITKVKEDCKAELLPRTKVSSSKMKKMHA